MQSAKPVSDGRPATLLEPLLTMQSGNPGTSGGAVSSEESKGSDQNFRGGTTSNVAGNDVRGRSIDDIVDSLGN